MEDSKEEISAWAELAMEWAVDVVAVIIILIVGFWVARKVGNGVTRLLNRSGKIDELIAGFLGSLTRYTLIALVLIAALDQFGIETTGFVALLGAAGLAIGLAFQGTLSSLAAGVMILFFRPFTKGQFIDAGGVTGTVDAVNLFVTELHTPDNVQIIVPNSQLWGTAIKNYSHHETRRVDFVLGIGYGDDIGKATDALMALISADERTLSDPEPMVVVSNLGESSVDLTIRVWVKAEDYWNVKFDLTRAMKEEMDAKEINIPYPHRTLHVINND